MNSVFINAFFFIWKFTYPDDTDDIELNEVCDVRDDGEWLDDDDVCDIVDVNEFRLAVSPIIVDGLFCTLSCRCVWKRRRRGKKEKIKWWTILTDGHDHNAYGGYG